MSKHSHIWVIMGLAALVVVIKGWGTGMSEEITVTVFASTVSSSPNQILDMNILSSRPVSAPLPEQSLATLQNAYLTPRTAVLATLFDGEDERSGMTEYEVQAGDVLGGIATDFGISLQTVISANNIKNIDALKPGTILKIPPVSGVIHTVKKGDTVGSLAKKYSAEQEKIINFNSLPLAGDLQIGDELIIPGGTLPAAPAQARAITGSQRFAGLPRFDGYFITPATCTITNLAHGRNGRDCAAPTGTPIYAAASGQVDIADGTGYNGGFGKYVRIKHGNGTETLYAHMSKVQVVAGSTVVQGQQIGLIGNTGRSSGSHLHLECHGCQSPLAGYKLRAKVLAKQQ